MKKTKPKTREELQANIIRQQVALGFKAKCSTCENIYGKAELKSGICLQCRQDQEKYAELRGTW
jgi:hypothetical protein